jgi:hypothetical protein
MEKGFGFKLHLQNQFAQPLFYCVDIRKTNNSEYDFKLFHL